MARLSRYFLPDQALHVIQRGNDRQAMFFSPDDYARYRDLARPGGRAIRLRRPRLCLDDEPRAPAGDAVNGREPTAHDAVAGPALCSARELGAPANGHAAPEKGGDRIRGRFMVQARNNPRMSRNLYETIRTGMCTVSFHQLGIGFMKKQLMKTLTIAALVAATSMGLAVGTAQASVIWYEATLSGPAENPPNASPGTGYARVIVDDALHTMQVSASFAGLLGTTTASHIHCCVAAPGNTGVATTVPSFPGFPLGVMTGNYDHLFDLTLASTYRSAFVTANGGVAGAEAALLAGLASNQAYFNIHSSVFPGGEIRGFLRVPEPSTLALITLSLLSLLSFGLIRRRTGA